jgi:hypothetical protein
LDDNGGFSVSFCQVIDSQAIVAKRDLCYSLRLGVLAKQKPLSAEPTEAFVWGKGKSRKMLSEVV